MRILYTSDLHGSTRAWRKWLATIGEAKADVAIYGGDLSGKVLVPIVEGPDGQFRSGYFGREWTLTSKAEAEEFEQRLEAAGAYGAVVPADVVDEWKANQTLAIEELDRRIRARLERWLEMAADVTSQLGCAMLVMPGNDDEAYVDAVIERFRPAGITLPVGEVVRLEAGVEVASLAVTSPTPWETPREFPDSEVGRLAVAEIERLERPRQAIFNFHCPPHKTRLDNAPKLDKKLKPVSSGGAILTEHVGSKAIRKLIDRHQPLLTLHGHIHESAAVDRVGRTVCCNPGSEYGEGIMRALIVDIVDAGVRDVARIER